MRFGHPSRHARKPDGHFYFFSWSTAYVYHCQVSNILSFSLIDAEVDITFGGMYLGVFLVEAKRSFENPLIVEGSSWAKGRLKFFSASDTSAPKVNEEVFGMDPKLNGIIELEFKPGELVPHFSVRHVQNRDNPPKEILMPNFKTATIGDLKREINKKFSAEVALLMVERCILEEDKSIR